MFSLGGALSTSFLPPNSDYVSCMGALNLWVVVLFLNYERQDPAIPRVVGGLTNAICVKFQASGLLALWLAVLTTLYVLPDRNYTVLLEFSSSFSLGGSAFLPFLSD